MKVHQTHYYLLMTVKGMGTVGMEVANIIRRKKFGVSHVPVTDSEAVPHFAKLFIEVEGESNLVLHLDALLDHNLLQVSLKAYLLELFLEFFDSAP